MEAVVSGPGLQEDGELASSSFCVAREFPYEMIKCRTQIMEEVADD